MKQNMTYDFLSDVEQGSPMSSNAISECVDSFQRQSDTAWRTTLYPVLGVIAISVVVCAITTNQGFVAAACGVGWMSLLLCFLYRAMCARGPVVSINTLTTTLPENLCSRMLDACEKTPEGRLYRRRVLAEGRKFLLIELKAMEAWNKNNDKRQDCKLLYGVTHENAIVAQ